MGGLLEFLNTDEGRLGLGLLAASGPRADGMGTGGRIQEAFQGQDAYKARQQAVQMHEAELRMKQMQEQRAQQQFKNQQEFYNGWGQQGAAPSQPMAGGQGAIPQGAMQGAPQGNQLMMLEKAALAGVPGTKELFDIYKYKNDPQKLDQGATYENRVTGKREFMPKIGEGVGPDGQGNYGALPGYAGALASIEGAKAGAIEGAKARFDPVTYTPQGNTTPVMTNRAALMTRQPGVTGSGYNGGSRDGANAESIRMIQSELMRPGNSPEDVAAMKREIAHLQAQSGIAPGGGIALQSPSEAAKLLDQVKADIIPTQQRQSAIASGDYLSQVLDMAIKHPGRETATGTSGAIDPRNYLPGTDAKNFHVVLDQIKGSAFMQAYQSLKGGGQITEVEGKKATDAIARMNTAQSDSEFLKSLNEFKGIVDKANTRMKASGVNQGGTTGDFSAAPKPVTPAPTPMKGMVRGGYKFKGGDPSNQSNWEQQ